MAVWNTTMPSLCPAQVHPSPGRLTVRLGVIFGLYPIGGQALSLADGVVVFRETQRRRIIILKMRWEGLSDEELVARYRAEATRSGSSPYINELFRRHHIQVASWCLAFTHDRESAADLAQEICAKAYQNLSSFREQSKFSTWLFSIARNHCLNVVRKHSSAPAMDSVTTDIDALPDLASEIPDAVLERKQLAEIARQLVCETLDETEKVVFTLHFAEELPLDVISRMLNLTNVSGAKAYLVSAKRKLERAVRIWKARG